MRCAVSKIGKSEPAAYHFSRNVASSAVWDLRLRKPFTSAIAPRSRVRRRRVVRAELQGQGMRNRYCWYNQKLVLPIEDISGQLFPAQLHPAPQRAIAKAHDSSQMPHPGALLVGASTSSRMRSQA